MKCGRLGESRARGPGEVPVYRLGPFFLLPGPKKMGSESAQVLKSYYAPTLLVLWGRNRVEGPPFSAVAKVQRGVPPESCLFRGLPPGTFGVFSDRRTRRVLRPLFRGDEEFGKLKDPAKDRGEKDCRRQGKKIS